MYEIGQLIVYGNEGVCRVEEIGTPKISGVDKHREYYTLAPIYREGKVFTPVDSKVFMRPVITREEALALIDRIPQMTAQVYENSNLRFLNEHYQQCIQDYTCADLLQLIKDVHARRCGLAGGRPRLNPNPRSRRTQCPAGFFTFLHFPLDRRANCVYATA